jgi:hypothetical protein
MYAWANMGHPSRGEGFVLIEAYGKGGDNAVAASRSARAFSIVSTKLLSNLVTDMEKSVLM